LGLKSRNPPFVPSILENNVAAQIAATAPGKDRQLADPNFDVASLLSVPAK